MRHRSIVSLSTVRVVVAGLLLCGAVSAKKRVSPDVVAETLINDGWKLFLAGQLSDARAKFQAAHDLFPNKAQPYRLLGLTDARLHHCDVAVKSLEQFLKRIKPDDSRYTEAITVRDQCRSQPDTEPGTLIVASSPAGAEVRLDEDRAPVARVTPFRDNAVPAGAHTLHLSKPGFAPVTQGFTVVPKSILRIDATMAPPGQIAPDPVISHGEEAPPALALVPPPSQPEPLPPSHRRAYLIAGIVVGALAIIGVAVGLSLGLTRGASDNPYETAALFPSVKGM